MTLEICAYNIQSCLIAQQAGADRIELCADPSKGGITASYGVIQYALETLTIPVFCMISPKGGDYRYDEHEIAIIKNDIVACRQLGIKGIATGAQLADGRIDTELLKWMVEWAYPMAVTCHKVFDTTPDAFEALEGVINAGCTRILTSGLAPSATKGASLLKKLVATAAGRITIMVGGGVRSSNIAQLIKDTGASEYHSSAINYTIGDFIADGDEVRKLAGGMQG